jgi:hypothetical protein
MSPAPRRRSRMQLPLNSMMWALDDTAVDNASLRAKALTDIRKAGFEGVTVFVRGGRYSWADREGIAALAHITELTAAMDMTFWLAADPRMISHRLVGIDGKRMVVSGESTVPSRVPLSARVIGGRFSARCRVRARIVHVMNEAAVTFRPIGVYHARLVDGPNDSGVDITENARFFYNANDGYVEAFGVVPGPAAKRARVLVFFLFETNHFDYASTKQRHAYVGALHLAHARGVTPSMIVWDEPGYPCIDGCFPVLNPEHARLSDGESVMHDIWRLTDAPVDRDTDRFRIAYYMALQEEISEARLTCNAMLGKAALPFRIDGIHDTWRWESADTADRLHGSLDIWKHNQRNSAGFVDLGSVQLLKNPESDFYSNLAGICAASLGLGRQSRSGVAYNNLWTVGEQRWQRLVLGHCIDVLALFGTRWIAHIYGPAGVLGSHRSFLGLDVTPGYPHHGTWPAMHEWNRRLKIQQESTEGVLPITDVAVVFPTETLYMLDKSQADAVFQDVFRLILFLTDHHLTVELLSQTELARSRRTAHGRTTVIVYPRPPQSAKPESGVAFYARPELLRTAGSHARPAAEFAASPHELLSRLRREAVKDLLTAPERTWVTRTRTSLGHVVTLIPSRCGFRYEGTLTFHGTEVDVPPHDGLCRLLFGDDGALVALERP